MANILDYMNWRSDLTLLQDPFNDVDSLILSTFCYVDFDLCGIDLSGCVGATIKEIGEGIAKLHPDEKLSSGRLISPEIYDLADNMSRSKRFQNMRVKYYVNEIDLESEKQFSAITIEMSDHSIYIAFRGTDDTIVGWKEDLNMSFHTTVPSQRRAVRYLKEVITDKNVRIRIGGHSKGGNLAVYAAAFIDKDIQQRILRVYNFDGPGFTKEILSSIEHQNIESRIVTIVPQSSVIGMLLEHGEKYDVVESKSTGIFQHNPFMWQLMGNRFNDVDDISADASHLDRTMREKILVLSDSEKEQFVEGMYYLLNETGAETLSDIKIKDVSKMLKILYQNDESANKTILLQVFKLLIQSSYEQKMLNLTRMGNKSNT